MEMPYVDSHELVIARPRDQVWRALDSLATRLVERRASRLVSILLRPEPPGGFGRGDLEHGHGLALTGRHRFAGYRLTFELDDEGEGNTRLTAITHASFPGIKGRAYRTLVIGSRGHILAVRRMLQSVERASMVERTS